MARSKWTVTSNKSKPDTIFIIWYYFGGDGRTTFGLPDLRGRVPIGEGTGPGLSVRRLGEKGGQETVTLTSAQIPSHSNSYNFKVKEGRGVKTDATGTSLAESGLYRDASSETDLASQSTENTGGSQSHPNMQPYQVLTFCVAIQGVYPSSN